MMRCAVIDERDMRAARERYAHSSVAQRRTLTEWIESL